jgi:hypothetical protein
VEVNRAPVGGGLAVTPFAGTALQTKFRLSGSSWADEHIPLSYAYSALPSRQGREALLCTFSNRTSCQVKSQRTHESSHVITSHTA